MYYTLKATNIYRVPTVSDALKLRTYLEKTSPGTLTSFTYITKQIKQKMEVCDEYQLVKATFAYDDEKDPEGNLMVYIDNEVTE